MKGTYMYVRGGETKRRLRRNHDSVITRGRHEIEAKLLWIPAVTRR